jgi:hypothetical protein
MDRAASEAWFGRLSQNQKADVLINVMHGLTIVVRSLFHDYENDCQTRSRLAYYISELNHHLTAAAAVLLENKPTYPDDQLIAMLSAASSQSELSPYFPFVLQRVIERFDNSLR